MLPSLWIANGATATIALFTASLGPLFFQGNEDDICKVWPFLMYNALLVLSQSTPPWATALPPSRPHLPPFSSPISLASSAPVFPNHRHKHQLPNWFVSLSVKARGYLQYVLTCFCWRKPPAYSLIHVLHSAFKYRHEKIKFDNSADICATAMTLKMKNEK